MTLGAVLPGRKAAILQTAWAAGDGEEIATPDIEALEELEQYADEDPSVVPAPDNNKNSNNNKNNKPKGNNQKNKNSGKKTDNKKPKNRN